MLYEVITGHHFVVVGVERLGYVKAEISQTDDAKTSHSILPDRPLADHDVFFCVAQRMFLAALQDGKGDRQQADTADEHRLLPFGDLTCPARQLHGPVAVPDGSVGRSYNFV